MAVHRDHQGHGLGPAIIGRLIELAGPGHKKIILDANPGAEAFYNRLGFHPMKTAMAKCHHPQRPSTADSSARLTCNVVVRSRADAKTEDARLTGCQPHWSCLAKSPVSDDERKET